MNKIWLQLLCYVGLLATSLALQALRPDLFALLCTPLPVGGQLGQSDRLDLPLNSPIVPKGERDK
jgi:hypothetical protein